LKSAVSETCRTQSVTDLSKASSCSAVRDIISTAHIIGSPQVHAAKQEVQYEANIGHLRHSTLLGLREDKDPREFVREHAER
jgi:hypothetical protein